MYIVDLTKEVKCIKTKSSIKISNKTNFINMGDYDVYPGLNYLVTITTDPNYYFVHNVGVLMPTDLFIDIDEWREELINSVLD